MRRLRRSGDAWKRKRPSLRWSVASLPCRPQPWAVALRPLPPPARRRSPRRSPPLQSPLWRPAARPTTHPRPHPRPRPLQARGCCANLAPRLQLAPAPSARPFAQPCHAPSHRQVAWRCRLPRPRPRFPTPRLSTAAIFPPMGQCSTRPFASVPIVMSGTTGASDTTVWMKGVGRRERLGAYSIWSVCDCFQCAHIVVWQLLLLDAVGSRPMSARRSGGDESSESSDSDDEAYSLDAPTTVRPKTAHAAPRTAVIRGATSGSSDTDLWAGVSRQAGWFGLWGGGSGACLGRTRLAAADSTKYSPFQ